MPSPATPMQETSGGRRIITCSADGSLRVWDRSIVKLAGHTDCVQSMRWSTDGERLVSGSEDGTIRVWDLGSGKTVSPDETKIATGGYHVKDKAIKIWDAKTGELLCAVKHDELAYCLAWTSDGKKLISGLSDGSIGVFDTVTWQQIAILDGHESGVNTISLSQSDRLIISASDDNTARLWNLDMNAQVGPPLQHEDALRAAAISIDGKLLVTCCNDKNAHVWDIHTILKDAGLEDLLSIPRKNTTRRSSLDANETRRPAQFKDTRRLPRSFFGDPQSSATHNTHLHLSVPRRHGAFTSSLGLRPHPPSGLSSLFRRSDNTGESTTLNQHPMRSASHHGPHIVGVAAVRDKETLYVARRPERISDMAKRIKNPTWWTRCILFICCVSVTEANGHQ